MLMRPLRQSDFEAWKVLYTDYAQPWGEVIDDQRLEDVWRMVAGENAPARNLACQVGDTLAGFAHFMIYPCTYSRKSTCYLQDLYVAPAFRRQGIAQAIFEQLTVIGKGEGWREVHWKTMPDNARAMALYDRVGKRSDRVHYHIPIGVG